jgi:hypothetical protein
MCERRAKTIGVLRSRVSVFVLVCACVFVFVFVFVFVCVCVWTWPSDAGDVHKHARWCTESDPVCVCWRGPSPCSPPLSCLLVCCTRANAMLYTRCLLNTSPRPPQSLLLPDPTALALSSSSSSSSSTKSANAALNCASLMRPRLRCRKSR